MTGGIEEEYYPHDVQKMIDMSCFGHEQLCIFTPRPKARYGHVYNPNLCPLPLRQPKRFLIRKP
jgi:hypothetical protein